MRGDCFITYGVPEVHEGHELIPLPGFNPISIHAAAECVPVWQSRTVFKSVDHQPWHNYTPAASKRLEAAFQNGKKRIELTFADAKFMVDTKAMQQARVGPVM